jgi:hypothetical protein
MRQKKDRKQKTPAGTNSHTNMRSQSTEESKDPQHSFGESEESIDEQDEENIEAEDEENIEDQDEEPIEREGMILVASGELGLQVDWEPGFEALGEVQWISVQLELLGQEKSIDWDTIIGDHVYFDGIRCASLYDESNFEQAFSEFLATVREPLNEMPGMTFNQLYLYVEADKREMVVQEFTRFLEHLKGLKVLQDAGIVWA